MIGTVYKSTGSWYWVKHNKTLYKCRIKGKFRIKQIKSTNPIAVGDRVVFELETKADSKIGFITTIKNRKNYIVRKSVNLSKQTHIIASNIDQVFLLITINKPRTLTTFIDRFLATAEAYSIRVFLVFNKFDTYKVEEKAEVLQLKNIYKAIGYTCLEVSALKRKNINAVKQLMLGKTSMFAGHSGVGKTTLINAIEPELNLKTKQISEYHKQGKHTTTFVEMFDLSCGAKIIDTPGIKGFGLVDINKSELADYFCEFFALKQYCKFHNCMHVNEPQCAVKNALINKKIAQSRYKSYLQILDGEQENYRVDIWK
ncbi:MAG: ribosome small subunit-dependent GTPase A [Tenacibaculum sp.]